MGADIHIVSQVRQPDGTWQDRTPDYPCRVCAGTGKYTRHGRTEPDACYWCDGSGKGGDYATREYRVFAILADVRNYDDVPVLAPMRGLPADFPMDEDDPADHGGKWMGDHSHSWFTLAELQAFKGWPESEWSTNYLPALAALGAPDEVRVVFGFDN